MGRHRNKRKERIKKSADNPFTAKTGVPVTRLTGKGAIPPEHTSPCHIISVGRIYEMPARKVAYAIYNNWQVFNINHKARKMRLLRVKQSCGIDQCVNPEHLVGTEKEYQPYQ